MTIRGRIWRRTVDVRSISDTTAVLIPAGWSLNVAVDGINRLGRDGMPTQQYALETCLNLIRGIKVGVITGYDRPPEYLSGQEVGTPTNESGLWAASAP